MISIFLHQNKKCCKLMIKNHQFATAPFIYFKIICKAFNKIIDKKSYIY